ncbi:transforming growth factor beta receptor type 3-like [Daphnia carinata]|uniref:transforming growth factor beta receptor type 3-like n=1 Tax=Daphnia carinata TaxID=120202 RepID=UPI00257FC086|nr:transforming growth factor beta receptor type 3-like [Daphnia carinata]
MVMARIVGRCCLLALVAAIVMSCWTTSTASPVARTDAFGAGPDLCVVQTPLMTRHFQAWRQAEEAVLTRGCSNRSGIVTTHEVHLIRLTNAGNSVLLEVDGTDKPANTRLALILDADTTVKWTVRLVGRSVDSNSQESTIIVTGNSVLDLSELKASVTNRPKEGRNALLRFIERRFKALHSFSQVDAGGSQLRLRLTLAAGSDASLCDYETTNASPVLQASRMEPQSVEGCFHTEQAGSYPKDVHVIDLDNGQPESKNKNNSVHIHLAAGGADEEMSQPRDVALVLKSARPVRWIVSSAPVLTGSLLILAEHQVDISGLSARQQSDVRSQQNLPESFPLLILSVTADLGPPVSYVKPAPATNSVEIVIGKKQQQQLRLPSSNVVKQQVENLNGAASHSSPSTEMALRSLGRSGGAGYSQQNTPNRGTGTQRSVAWTLQQSVRVQCGSNYLTASLPRPMAEALGVVGLFLNDRGCSGKRNASHWMVKTHVTSCGSTSRIDGKLTTYSNAVHIQLRAVHPQQNDDEDFEGSGVDGYPSSAARQVTIPIQCHSEPNFPVGFGDKLDDDNVMDTDVDLPVGQTDLYHMEIHRNKEWTVPVVTGPMNEASKAEVVFDETLHVRTWIDGVSYIQIVTEKCWVSNSSDSEQPPRLILIRNTCPADLSVQVRQIERGDTDGGFSFHVSKDYADLGQLYIHCKLGLCSNQPSKVQGSLKMCIDPSQYCSGRHVLKPFLDESVSTAQQILVRGPLRMVAKATFAQQNKIGASGDVTTSPGSLVTAGQNNGVTGTQQVILVGVSTEVTVGIALASFVIGVGLTAILWCIHMRTDPYRRVMNRKTRSSRSNNRCQAIGAKCSPMIRPRSGVDHHRTSLQQVAIGTQQQQQQLIAAQPASDSMDKQPQQLQHQFTYDYDVSSSQSNSSGSQCSREDSSPTPNSQTPMNVASAR